MKTFPFSLLGVVALSVLAGTATVDRAGAQRQRGPIQVETNLVEILASVIDPHGEPVAGLGEDQFQVSEEGVPQKIVRFEAQTNRPLDLALMVDSSSSEFGDLKFEDEAAARFIRQIVRPTDRLAVFEFDEDVTELADFSSDVPRLQAAVRRILPGSGTSMYDALVLASSELKGRPSGRRRAIVLVTDAGETTSGDSFDQARRAAISSGALLYPIIVRVVKSENGRNTAGEHALITIQNDTGGAMFFLDDLSQLNSVFDRIDRELRTQYLLGYYPNPQPPPGSYRHVAVKVKSGDLVHFRKGYFSAGAPQEKAQ
ncbi:MAG TPA: VWA domain-containing protein [Candidatus Acidoferrales bacterium]|nr:VWA domain-containing protein [Candidatus Acidoferrales bacterium]